MSMKNVLMVSWSWHPVGGDWTYINNLHTLYSKNGYNVIPFSTKNPLNNLSDEEEKYFIDNFSYKQINEKRSVKSYFSAISKSVVSFEALKNIDLLLDEINIDFAHLHLIHHWITPSIIWKLKERNIPIIWTLHEYKILCPEGTFFSNGEVCEKCFNGKYYSCFLNKCKKNSSGASLLAAMDAYFYNSINIYDKVDKFLCPSEFLMKKFIQYGYDNSKLELTNYCYDIDYLDNIAASLRLSNKPDDKYLLYVGRIEKNKGILTLLQAVNGTKIPLKIIGEGSYLPDMIKFVKENDLTNVEFLGFQNKENVIKYSLASSIIVCPSEWYENYPFSIIESLLLGKPVIGANIGGIPELVINGKSGFLFEPRDYNQLRELIIRIWDDDELLIKVGQQASEYIREKVNFETHWGIINNILSNLHK